MYFKRKMAQKIKSKTFYFNVNADEAGFVSRLLKADTEIDFSDIKLLRSLLSNEKARILYFLKHKKPKSIYDLAKMLGRDFKSVREDLLMLERFGLVAFFSEKHGRRERLMPILAAERINITLSI
ncbi:ArsR family transcriptional regulator [Candidatus Pacearchaeota archaeon]|nr:MAG: ArsR family transcriptional regulator [Candidatus Pacearchaeota archaeon]